MRLLLILRLLLALITTLLVVVLLGPTLRMVLAMVLLIAVVFMIAMITLCKLLRHMCRAALEIDVHSTSICLCRILQAKFLTDLLNARFDFLNVIWGMIAFADDAAD